MGIKKTSTLSNAGLLALSTPVKTNSIVKFIIVANLATPNNVLVCWVRFPKLITQAIAIGICIW